MSLSVGNTHLSVFRGDKASGENLFPKDLEGKNFLVQYSHSSVTLKYCSWSRTYKQYQKRKKGGRVFKVLYKGITIKITIRTKIQVFLNIKGNTKKDRERAKERLQRNYTRENKIREESQLQKILVRTISIAVIYLRNKHFFKRMPFSERGW